MNIPNHLKLEHLPPGELKDYHRQLRKPSKNQIDKTARLIESVGFVVPVVIDRSGFIIVGSHFVEAARRMKLEEIPVIRADHLDEGQVRTLRLAYDRIAAEAEWDREALAAEFEELMVILPDMTVTGFDLEEIDLTLDLVEAGEPEDKVPAVADGPAITKPGDLWQLGSHYLLCGDALSAESYAKLMREQKADMVFTDPPYNVKIDGHVGNSGAIKHREFEMASGEMDAGEFIRFQSTAYKYISQHCRDGAVSFICMDWRHLRELFAAADAANFTMMNLCVWVKNNGGMGSLYRSRHELVAVFKNGTGKHVNNVQLGKNGRNRTNVWEYPGISSFGEGRMDELRMHPTVKPAAMVADAIKDCSRRGDIILDPFGGSGTTLIAAEMTGRQARIIELDPLYCDVITRRWQNHTGGEAINSNTGMSFNQIEQGGNYHE